MELMDTGELVFDTGDPGDAAFLYDMGYIAGTVPAGYVNALHSSFFRLAQENLTEEQWSKERLHEIIENSQQRHMEIAGGDERLPAGIGSTLLGGTQIILPKEFTAVALITSHDVIASRVKDLESEDLRHLNLPRAALFSAGNTDEFDEVSDMIENLNEIREVLKGTIDPRDLEAAKEALSKSKAAKYETAKKVAALIFQKYSQE